MRPDLLARVPVGAYGLVLVHDPDGLLDPQAREALSARGCHLLEAPEDNLALWAQAAALRPWAPEAPLVILSPRPLEELPYDLWAQAHRISYSLTELAPGLALPCLRELTLDQRERLAAAALPAAAAPLGRRATVRRLLEILFEADLARLVQPGELLLWLDRVHSELGPLPPSVRAEVAQSLGALPIYAGWPLEALLSDVQAYRQFLQTAWEAYQRGAPGGHGELFADRRVQDAAGALVRRGHLRPGVLPPGAAYRTGGAGPWAMLLARTGGVQRAYSDVAEELAALLDEVERRLPEARSWEHWVEIAWLWARALVLAQAESRSSAATAGLGGLRKALDVAWGAWLRANLAPLAGQRLPTPHQVHHIAHWLARRRRARPGTRLALLILDGCSLADWAIIGPAWQDAHPGWQLTQASVLAQIPTVTSISRQALLSGLQPEQFADTLTSTAAEAVRWRAHWTRQGVAAEGVAYGRLVPGGPQPGVTERTVALALVETSIDDLVHGASLGAAQVQDALLRWRHDRSPEVEATIEGLLDAGYSVYLASDHGHVEATGVGRPPGGALTESQGQRARLYHDRLLAEEACRATSGELWGPEALLPEGWWAVTARDREAFTIAGERCVTHGGATIEEVMVPLITIERQET